MAHANNQLTLVKPAIRRVPVVVLHFQWISAGPLPVPWQKSRCTACRKLVGTGRVGGAWIRDGSRLRSVRLCEACGLKAEASIGQELWSGMEGTMEPTRKQIEEKLSDAIGAAEQGSKNPGMTYEQGVEAALRWVLGEGGDPLEE